ncbi:nodulation protein NfeD [Paenibacillus sp. MAHUQ-46]|uniref:Nodulation protein NfeD n=2 Tax=Paenibacillus TaxID=44249 RepID=A0A934J4G7_9BACL|nr:nodulation protein NfeD [Paenibacillus roseus]
MKPWLLRLLLLLLLLPMIVGLPALTVAAASTSQQASAPASHGTAVFVVPVKQTIESGLQSFLERAYAEAEKAKAEKIILVVDTLGGKIINADEIGGIIRSSKIPTVAYVENRAISAGAYISLNAEQIIMHPGSTIGAAAVVDGSGTLIDDPKIVSAWVAAMRSAAESNGRDPEIAMKMADPFSEVKIEGLNKTFTKGQVVTLSAEEAVKVGYAEHIANSVESAVKWLGLDERTIIEFNPSLAEKVARFVTAPGLSTLLLILGIAGIAIELFVPGFGIPGFIGLLSFGLYFFGHYIAGFAGLETALLFVVGIGLLIVELFVPSFGILGMLGIASLVGGIVMVSYDTGATLGSLVIAVIAAAAVVAVFSYIFKKRGIWNKFILRESLTSEEGFIPAESKILLQGLEGIALTPLRPSGTVDIAGERVDVVTSGEFITAGKRVKVVKVDGTRVIVSEVV